MRVTDYLNAILVGALIGVLGRLILPGRQRIGVLPTLLVGVGAAVLGSWLTHELRVDRSAGVQVWKLHWDWVVLTVQLVFAVIGIGLANVLTHTKLATPDEDGVTTSKKRTRRGPRSKPAS